jgi:hypothetical protein
MQVNDSQTKSQQDPEEDVFTFRKLFSKWIRNIVYILSFWRLLVFAGVIGSLLGLFASWYKSPTYTARLTFVVEEAKSGGGSIASALAGQIGFDLSSLSGTNGILAGDNVLELLKSHSLIKKTLLTPYGDSTKTSLADQYAEVYAWKEKWKTSSKVGREVNFPAGQQKFSRLEDSLLQRIIKNIVEEELSIAKPDKKLGFFEINVSTRDEKISQLFCERLLKNTTDFYVGTKTKRLANNVARLQNRADSLGILLDRKTYSAAESSRLLLDANPAYSAPSVDAEISSRNKYIQGVVYSEIVKNLEASKTALIQETPTVQIVDYPDLPLKRNRLFWAVGMAVGAAMGVLLMGLSLLAVKKEN